MKKVVSTISPWLVCSFLVAILEKADGYCPKPCNCNSGAALEINCESKNLNHVPILPRSSERRMEGILLGHNKIRNIFSSTFGGIQARYIYLSGNPLSIIAHDAFSHIRDLHLLDLENCGLKVVNFYPKFSASTRKYYLNMNMNQINTISHDFVSDVVRRSDSKGKQFYIELERNALKTIDFIGDTCEVKKAHLVHINVKNNPIHCDCALHAALFKAGETVRITGRCSTPQKNANIPIKSVFMEKARIECNRTCLDDIKYDCKIHAWSYGNNETCKALPLCKNGAIVCREPTAGSVRTAVGSSCSQESVLTLKIVILLSSYMVWLNGR